MTGEDIAGPSTDCRQRGRPRRVATGMFLARSRDLRERFDQFWCEVGMRFEAINSRAHLKEALTPMRSCGDGLIQLLLIELDSASVKRIRAIVGPYDAQRIGQILQWSEYPPATTKSEFPKKAAKKLRTEQLIMPCKAFFAQEELANFCGQRSIKRRYEISPYSLGCAMAGIPAVGWRRSMKVCKAADDPAVAYMDGSQYATVKILSSLIRYSDKRSNFWKRAAHREELVSKWLRNSHFKTKVSVQSLKDHQGDLMRALDTVLSLGPSSAERPYAIAREYFRIQNQKRILPTAPTSGDAST